MADLTCFCLFACKRYKTYNKVPKNKRVSFPSIVVWQWIVDKQVDEQLTALSYGAEGTATTPMYDLVFGCAEATNALPRQRVAPATGQDSTTLPRRSCEGRHVQSRGQPVQ